MANNSVEVEIFSIDRVIKETTNERILRVMALAPTDCNLHIGKAIIEQLKEIEKQKKTTWVCNACKLQCELKFIDCLSRYVPTKICPIFDLHEAKWKIKEEE